MCVCVCVCRHVYEYIGSRGAESSEKRRTAAETEVMLRVMARLRNRLTSRALGRWHEAVLNGDKQRLQRSVTAQTLKEASFDRRELAGGNMAEDADGIDEVLEERNTTEAHKKELVAKLWREVTKAILEHGPVIQRCNACRAYICMCTCLDTCIHTSMYICTEHRWNACRAYIYMYV